MTEDRRKSRVEWLAIGVAMVFLGVGILGVAEADAYLARRNGQWAEGLAEFLRDFAWLPLMAGAWWVKIRVEGWLNGV